eukprot:2659957-Rhodomonas_salina.1
MWSAGVHPPAGRRRAAAAAGPTPAHPSHWHGIRVRVTESLSLSTVVLRYRASGPGSPWHRPLALEKLLRLLGY